MVYVYYARHSFMSADKISFHFVPGRWSFEVVFVVFMHVITWSSIHTCQFSDMRVFLYENSGCNSD